MDTTSTTGQWGIPGPPPDDTARRPAEPRAATAGRPEFDFGPAADGSEPCGAVYWSRPCRLQALAEAKSANYRWTQHVLPGVPLVAASSSSSSVRNCARRTTTPPTPAKWGRWWGFVGLLFAHTQRADAGERSYSYFLSYLILRRKRATPRAKGPHQSAKGPRFAQKGHTTRKRATPPWRASAARTDL